MTVFGAGIPYKLLGNGDGVVSYVGKTESFIRFLGPVITLDSDEEIKTFDAIKSYYKGEVVEGLQLETTPTQQKEEPIEKLKRIILTTGETRLKELQKKMKIRMSEVSDMMKQLVEEEVLRKDGKSYEIVEKDEQK
jgi:DNA segregation ATPase FtsK/SpoIIIE, S-DNA-T family